MEKDKAEKPRTRFSDYMLNTVAGLRYDEKDGVGFWQSPLLLQTGCLHHGFTTRKGGVSTGPYADMNLSVTRTADIEQTKRNYALAAGALGIDLSNSVLVDGIHGVNIKHVKAENRGDGLIKPYGHDEDFFDGMMTDTPGVALITIHADCTPLFLFDTKHLAVGLCHAGWRGTVDGMGMEIISAMRNEFNTQPKDLLCMIGPHIGACCFEVHDDVAERFAAALPGFGGIRSAKEAGKSFVDLTLAMAYQLFMAGVPAQQLNIAHLCTCCNETMFHSYRRDGMTGGAMASFVQLRV